MHIRAFSGKPPPFIIFLAQAMYWLVCANTRAVLLRRLFREWYVQWHLGIRSRRLRQRVEIERMNAPHNRALLRFMFLVWHEIKLFIRFWRSAEMRGRRARARYRAGLDPEDSSDGDPMDHYVEFFRPKWVYVMRGGQWFLREYWD